MVAWPKVVTMEVVGTIHSGYVFERRLLYDSWDLLACCAVMRVPLLPTRSSSPTNILQKVWWNLRVGRALTGRTSSGREVGTEIL